VCDVIRKAAIDKERDLFHPRHQQNNPAVELLQSLFVSTLSVGILWALMP
jgi:hypothetical protein